MALTSFNRDQEAIDRSLDSCFQACTSERQIQRHGFAGKGEPFQAK